MPDDKTNGKNDHRFEYMMLDRLRSDCEYFLGAGQRYEGHLWAGNVREHIAKMRELYNALPVKPEWLSQEDIDNYAERMEPPFSVVEEVNLQHTVEKIHVDPQNESVWWIYLNPYADCGAQYVNCEIDFDVYEQLIEQYDIAHHPENVEQFYSDLNEMAEQMLSDLGTPFFVEARNDYEKESDFVDFTAENILKIHEKILSYEVDREAERDIDRGEAEFGADGRRAFRDDVGSVKKRLFVDMDGTLAVFKPVDTLETLYSEGYFASLEPQQEVIDAIDELLSDNEFEVFVLSAYLSDSPYALSEKNEWLDEHLPNISPSHRLFVPCGEDKASVVPGGISEGDYLLDDYTLNLLSWDPPGHGIKLLNGINHTKGTWKKDKVRHDQNGEALAQKIRDIAFYGRNVRDSDARHDSSER